MDEMFQKINEEARVVQLIELKNFEHYNLLTESPVQSKAAKDLNESRFQQVFLDKINKLTQNAKLVLTAAKEE